MGYSMRVLLRFVCACAEEALRAEVVRNYKAFMHATEEIRSMETGIQTLKDLLGATSTTLQVRLGSDHVLSSLLLQ